MSHDAVDEALAWDGIPALGPVWDELARRMGASDRPVRRVHVTDLDDFGRRRLASLFGLPRIPRDTTVSVDTAKLATALGLDQPELRALVERLRGPLGNRAATARADAEARAALWAEADARLGVQIPRTLARIRSAGVPGNDVASHGCMLARLAAALDRLPAQSPLPLPMLAWQVCGDPHGLDPAATTGRYLQLASVELMGGDPDAADSITIRRALMNLGIVVDRLSTGTIVCGVRCRPDTPLGRLLGAGNEAQVPVSISGATLDRGAPRFDPASWLCVENPSLVEHATQFDSPPPMVCTSGWPSTDTQRLLDLARQQGIELCYAGDYDGEGLAIAAWMAVRYGARILMTAATYEAADLEHALPWKGAVPETPWDPALADAIRARRRIVYQEDPAVYGSLLTADLGSATQ